MGVIFLRTKSRSTALWWPIYIFAKLEIKEVGF